MLAILLVSALVQAPARAAAVAPVRIAGTTPAPARTGGAMPVYPPELLQRKVGGIVTIDVTIDAAGKVTSVRPVRGIPEFEAAATSAARGWTYHAPPATRNGKAAPAVLTVVLAFDADTGHVEDLQRIAPQGPQPRRTKTAPAVYPPDLRASRQQGRVVIDAVVSREGRVIDARVMSGTGGFEGAALDAVRQWEYAPLVVNGHAVPFVVTVTVLFTPK